MSIVNRYSPRFNFAQNWKFLKNENKNNKGKEHSYTYVMLMAQRSTIGSEQGSEMHSYNPEGVDVIELGLIYLQYTDSGVINYIYVRSNSRTMLLAAKAHVTLASTANRHCIQERSILYQYLVKVQILGNEVKDIPSKFRTSVTDKSVLLLQKFQKAASLTLPNSTTLPCNSKI